MLVPSLVVVPAVSPSPNAPGFAEPAIAIACDSLVLRNRRHFGLEGWEQRVCMTELVMFVVVAVVVLVTVAFRISLAYWVVAL